MDVLTMNFEIAEHGTVEFAEYLVVIAGDENHFGAALGLAEDGAQHIVMRLRPVHAFLHAPHVDDVTDQEQEIHFHVMQEIQEQVGAAAFEAQMDV